MNDLTPILFYDQEPCSNASESATLGSFDAAAERAVVARPLLDELKVRMLCEALDAIAETHSPRQLRLAAERAAAMSAETPFPVLMFPCLFEEMRQVEPTRLASV